MVLQSYRCCLFPSASTCAKILASLQNSKSKVYDIVKPDFAADLSQNFVERPEWLPASPELLFIVPARFAFLIWQQAWQDICLPSPFIRGMFKLAEWKLDAVGHMFAHAFQGRRAGGADARNPPAGQFDLAACQDLADDLRGLLRHMPEEDVGDISMWVSKLQNTSDEMALPPNESDKFHRLIDFVFFCDLLRDVSVAKEAVHRALKLTLPKSVLGVAETHLKQRRLYDKSQVSRFRVVLDVSLMLWLRAFRWNASFVSKTVTSRYMMWDSSPQHSRDYEMIRIVSIPEKDLLPLLASAKQMSSMWCLEEMSLNRRLIQNQDAGEHQQEEDMMCFAAEVFSPHICPAVVLGFGATSLAHKFHTLAHAFRLEHFNADSLAGFCKEFVSVTSDFGVEHMLTRVGPVPVSTECQFFEDSDPASISQVLKLAPSASSRSDQLVFEEPVAQDAIDLGRAVFQQHGAMDGVGEVVVEPVLFNIGADFEDAGLDSPVADPIPLYMQEMPFADLNPDVFEDVPAPPSMDFRDMLSFPGIHHILDNAVNGFDGVMVSYKGQLDLAGKLCKFIHQAETRDILLSRCFDGAVGEQFHEQIRAFQGNIYPGRWGAVSFSVPQLRALERPLRWAWDKQRFLQDPNARNGSVTVLVEKVDQAIEEPLFWAWLCMLEQLVFILRKATHWLESCPCHWGLLQQDTEQDPLPKNVCKRWRRCPMRGLRAAEVCTGDFLDIVRTVCDQSAVDILQRLPRDISAEQRAHLLNEFNAGRTHLCFYLALKLTVEEWPWKKCGLAHMDERVARHVLHEALASESEHVRLRRLRVELRPLCERFLAGESLRSPGTQDLGRFVAELCFIPVNERPAEALHRQTKLHGRNRPRHTVAFMSLKQRVPELKQLLDAKPNVLQDLAALTHHVRNNKLCVTSLGLRLHPSVQAAAGRRNGFRNPLLAQIVYHCDAHTLYSHPVPQLPMDNQGDDDDSQGPDDNHDAFAPGDEDEDDSDGDRDDEQADGGGVDNGSDSDDSSSSSSPGQPGPARNAGCNPGHSPVDASAASLADLVRSHTSESAALLKHFMLQQLCAMVSAEKGSFLSFPYNAKATRTLESVLKVSNQQRYELGDDVNLESKLDIHRRRGSCSLPIEATLAHRKDFTDAARALMFFQVVRANPKQLKRQKTEHERGFSSADVVVAPRKLRSIDARQKTVSVEATALVTDGALAGHSLVIGFASMDCDQLIQLRSWTKSEQLQYCIRRDILPEADKWGKDRQEALAVLLAELVESETGARETCWRLTEERREILKIFSQQSWVVQSSVPWSDFLGGRRLSWAGYN